MEIVADTLGIVLGIAGLVFAWQRERQRCKDREIDLLAMEQEKPVMLFRDGKGHIKGLHARMRGTINGAGTLEGNIDLSPK